MTHILTQLSMYREWKFASMEAFIQSVILAGIIVMLRWHAIKSTHSVDMVRLQISILVAAINNSMHIMPLQLERCILVFHFL